MKKLPNIRFLLTAALVLLLADAAWACPTCKEAIANDPSSQNVVRGYFWSIIFMISMPIVISSTFGFYVYRTMKKLRKAQAAEALSKASVVAQAADTSAVTNASAATDQQELSEASV